MKTIRVDEITTHTDVTYNQLIKTSPEVGLISTNVPSTNMLKRVINKNRVEC